MIENPEVRMTRWTLGTGEETGLHDTDTLMVGPLTDG